MNISDQLEALENVFWPIQWPDTKPVFPDIDLAYILKSKEIVDLQEKTDLQSFKNKLRTYPFIPESVKFLRQFPETSYYCQKIFDWVHECYCIIPHTSDQLQNGHIIYFPHISINNTVQDICCVQIHFVEKEWIHSIEFHDLFWGDWKIITWEILTKEDITRAWKHALTFLPTTGKFEFPNLW